MCFALYTVYGDKCGVRGMLAAPAVTADGGGGEDDASFWLGEEGEAQLLVGMS
jgi:hypothetical protein